MKKLLSFVSIWLLLMTLLAGFLRFYRLGELPAGFHIDEASLGYNGYSMLKTGRDEHGNTFPLYIDMFGDNRPSGYHYLTIVPVAIFGLNEFATRLPGAFFGTISVIAFYYLAFAVTRDKKISLLASLLLAISPWHIVSSRASAESIVALFFIMVGFACVIRSLTDQHIRRLIFGFVLLVISFQLYHTPRVFVPLIIGCLAAAVIKNRARYSVRFKLIGFICCVATVLLATLLVFGISGGTGRFSQVSIFGFPQTRLVMEEQFREDGVMGTPLLMVRAFHNKIINYFLTFVSNYTDYFSGKFLFMEGGKPPWYKIPDMGLLYLAELPFIIIGFTYLFIQKRLIFKFPLAWIALAPVVASITTDDIPNIQRSMVLFPMLELIAAFGIVRSWRTVGSIFIVIIFTCNALYFFHQYAVHGSSHQTLYRFNGFKEMVTAVKNQYNDVDRIVMTKTGGGMYPHVLFFMKYEPSIYQKEGSPKDPDFKGFGKFIFSPQFCPSVESGDNIDKTGRVLFVDSGTCEISPLVKSKKIFREDGSLAFVIVYPN